MFSIVGIPDRATIRHREPALSSSILTSLQVTLFIFAFARLALVPEGLFETFLRLVDAVMCLRFEAKW